MGVTPAGWCDGLRWGEGLSGSPALQHPLLLYLSGITHTVWFQRKNEPSRPLGTPVTSLHCACHARGRGVMP